MVVLEQFGGLDRARHVGAFADGDDTVFDQRSGIVFVKLVLGGTG